MLGNIVSFPECVDKLYYANYDREKDTFIVQPYEKGDRYYFTRDEETNLYLCEICNRTKVLVNTVADEIIQADKARKIREEWVLLRQGS